MTITIMPVTPGFAAEIADVDVARPLAAADAAAIMQAFADYAVLIFPEQILTQEQQLRFAEYFGPLEHNLLGYNPDAEFRVNPALVDISNLTPGNEIWSADSRMRQFYLGNQMWHTDSSFKYLPARASMLYAHSVAPIGGHTEFADMRAAYDSLPIAVQHRIAGLVAMHALAYSRAKSGFTAFTEAERKHLPPVPQMLVRTVPESGRQSLYIAAHIGAIVDMETEAAMALVEELMAHATQRQFLYVHRWRVGDLVLWDNRCTMHRGTHYDDLRYVREMHRATVADVANTCEQAGMGAAPASVAARS